MQNRYVQWGVRGLVVVGLLSLIECSKSSPHATELLLTITSDNPLVASVEIRARNIHYDQDTITEPLKGRNIVSDPLVLLIKPSTIASPSQDKKTGGFLIYAKGLDAQGKVVVAASKRYWFIPKRRETAKMVMLEGFIDADDDGFPACNTGPNCDCNDQNPNINPFTIEKCGDGIDNNCSGLPIDEGCQCVLGSPPVPCTSLSKQLLPLAGIGICNLGYLKCLDDGHSATYGVLQTTCNSGEPNLSGEIPNNYLDDNCNGSVDEGSTCSPVGKTRPCLLGFVDDPNAPTPPGPLAATKLAKGICKPGKQPCLDDGLGDGKGIWGSCDNTEVRPQRNPITGFGWIELPPGVPDPNNPGKTLPDQCNGLDDDCDGIVDDEPYYDADGDNYTYCGTCTDSGYYAMKCSDCKFKDPNSDRCDDAIDCDDSNAAINPGATEVCGSQGTNGWTVNGVDEDCRCDENPSGVSATDPNSDIGLPYNRVDGGTNCSANESHLDCTQDVRSDPTIPGVCSDNNNGPPYYFGYFPDPTSGDCYYCGASYGHSCPASGGGACSTKAQDCSNCSARSSQVAETRPKCAVPFTQANCQTYGGTNCSTPSCNGTSPARWIYPNGADPNDECPAQTCNDKESGEGPFYFGIQGTPPICYRAAGVPGSCDGAGACMTRAAECATAGKGEADPDRQLCMKPLTNDPSTCKGATPPTYSFVDQFTDPYGDCGATSCDGAGHCTVAQGGDCSGGQMCDQGLSCVDGVCCNAPSCGTCEACNVTNFVGTCHAVNDTTDPNTCDGVNQYCCAGNCVTVAGGYGAACGTGHGECAGTNTCSGTKGACSTHNQACAYCNGDTAYQGLCDDNGACPVASTCAACTACSDAGTTSSCTPVTPSGTADTAGSNTCTGSTGCTHGQCACDGSGNCKSGIGATCGANSDCLSGFCADGYCCNTACTGTCNRCDVSGKEGTCTDVDSYCGGGDCAKCTNGTCGPNPASCSVCNQCVSSGSTYACSPESDGPQTGCNSGNAYCCHGNCTGRGTGWNQSCGDTTAGSECAGGHNTCSKVTSTAAACSTENTPCAYCSADAQYGGGGAVCDINGNCPSAGTSCPSCTSCTDGGTSTSCVNIQPPQTDDTTGSNMCTGGTGGCGSSQCTCDGSGNCKSAAGQACNGGNDCASGACQADWDGVGQYCATSSTTCVYDPGSGPPSVQQLASGSTICALSSGAPETKTCNNGQWKSPSGCNTYVCTASGTACMTSCGSDADCTSGNYCNGSSQCVPGKAAGASCTASDQCASGYCRTDFDGVGSYCASNATSCVYDATGSGTAAQVNDTATQCGFNAAQTAYQTRQCSAGAWGPVASCGQLICTATGASCLGSCSNSDANCLSGDYCDGSACHSLVAAGGSCAGDAVDSTGNHQCSSGHCRTDFDTNGTFCAQDASSCVYDTSGTGTAVQQITSGTVQCGQGTSAVETQTCNNGQWGTSSQCSPYAWCASSMTCGTNCDTNDDTKCATGYHCDQSTTPNTCVANFADGAACVENSDCTHPYCHTDWTGTATYCATSASTCVDDSGGQQTAGSTLCNAVPSTTGHFTTKTCGGSTSGQWDAGTVCDPYVCNATNDGCLTTATSQNDCSVCANRSGSACQTIASVDTADTSGTYQCTTGAGGCGATSCACDGSGSCLRAGGMPCGTSNSVCASNSCNTGTGNCNN